MLHNIRHDSAETDNGKFQTNLSFLHVQASDIINSDIAKPTHRNALYTLTYENNLKIA